MEIVTSGNQTGKLASSELCEIQQEEDSEINESNDKYKVAVIITSYNTEKYISEAVNSALNQTLADIQVIVVDDGSTDQTQSIIEELAKDKNNFKYKFLSNTGSPSQPRNYGIMLANAEYLMFLDGDDYLALDGVENLYNKATMEKADITISKMISFRGNKFFESSSRIPRFKERYELEMSIANTKEMSIFTDPVLYLFPSSCAKLFKSDLIKNRIWFNKDIKYAEDLLFSMECFLTSSKTVITNDEVYFYRGKTDGHTNSTTQQRSLKNLQDLNFVMKRIELLLLENDERFPSKSKFNYKLHYYRMLEANQHLEQLTEYHEEERLEAAKLIKEALFSIDFDKDRVKVFTIINYMKLILLLDEKYDELVTLCNLLVGITMYDYLGKYPFTISKINEDIFWSFPHEGKSEKINITHIFEENELVNRLVDININGDFLEVDGIAYFNNIPITKRGDIKHEIILKHRKSKAEYKFKTKLVENNKFSTSVFKYAMGGYRVKIHFNEQLKQGVYDVFIESSFHGFKKMVPLGGMINKFIYKAKNHFIENEQGYFEINPVVKSRKKFTIIYNKLDNKFVYLMRRVKANLRQKQYSLRQIKNNKFLSKDKKVKLAIGVLTEDLTSLFFKDKEVWMIGEKVGKSANDTGYWFYKYCRENMPEKKVYYIIDKKAPDYCKVKDLGNVLNYYSLKHIIYSIHAKYIFSSDNVNILLPSNINHLRRATRVFIQHGIILPGRVENVYHSYRDLNDFILSSSDFEKRILKNHFGYNNHEILNVGLPRFDSLGNKVKDNRIMLTFTWRKDILNLPQLLESSYFKTIKSLINNESLLSLLEDNQIKLDLCLHPRTCELLGEEGLRLLQGENKTGNIEIHDFNKVDVRALIERSSLLLTDYSSISFDFIFLQKPVINYLFQNNTPISKDKIADTLPGYVVYEEKKVISSIESMLIKKKVLKKVSRDNYIKYTDGENCKRLVSSIIKQH